MGGRVELLYNVCLRKFVEALTKNVISLELINSLKKFPPLVLTDIYSQMAEKENLMDTLMAELSNIDLFIKLLRYNQVRENVFKCIKFLMNYNKPVASEIQKRFVEKSECDFLEATMQINNEKVIMNNDDIELNSDSEICSNFSDEISSNQYININHSKNYMYQIDSGMRLGAFLSECGWLDDSRKVLSVTLRLIQQLDKSHKKLILELNCLQKLLHVQALFCCYKEANVTSAQALCVIEQLCSFNGTSNSDIVGLGCAIEKNNYSKIPNCIPDSLLANFYHELSVLHFYRSEYDLSYKWSAKALEYLKHDTPLKVCIDVLRQASKSCVVKRKFPSANYLINNAVRIALNFFGPKHHKYADALLDKGFFLLNVDSIQRSVDIYREALSIKQTIFGERNIYVAVAHEDLAYALYVFEYSSGRFNNAQFEVERAIDIMNKLVPRNHLMLASAKRVKALILEEIALDNTPESLEATSLLKESETLHQSALELSLDAFGEINVQTAKHYGNLGRLYQSMHRYESAEQMHQRAIKIKTDLLGAFDYEVGLSIGHLASLYNYHMKKFREAELLYKRSINISLRLFGKSYSGLEYDYRGLLHVYEELSEETEFLRYCQILDNWRSLRNENNVGVKPLYVETSEDVAIEEIIKTFFESSVN